MAAVGGGGERQNRMLRYRNIGLPKLGEKLADKPGSVGARMLPTAIPLGPGLLQGSSHLPASSAGRVIACLFGVAPGRGCLAVRLTADAVRSYRTVSPLPDPAPTYKNETLPPCGVKVRRGPSAVYSLWPCSSPHGGR